MNINDMKEFVTGMTSCDLDLLAKMAKEELERRAKNKKKEAWDNVCKAIREYQKLDNVTLLFCDGDDSWEATLDDNDFIYDTGVLFANH